MARSPKVTEPGEAPGQAAFPLPPPPTWRTISPPGGLHGIQGIGDGSKFLVDLDKVDEIITISTEEAKQRALRLAKENGLFVGGGGSGAGGGNAASGADSGGGGASGYSNGTVTITSAEQGGNNSSFAFAQIRLLT